MFLLRLSQENLKILLLYAFVHQLTRHCLYTKPDFIFHQWQKYEGHMDGKSQTNS